MNNLLSGTFRPYKPEPFFARDRILYIQGYGERHLPIDHGYDPKALFHLCKVAYVLNFITNVVSYKRLKTAGYRLDDERNVIMRDNKDIFRIYEKFGQTVIHYKAVVPVAFTATTATTTTTTTTVKTDPSTAVTPVTAPPATVPIFSRKPRKHKPTDDMTWHLRCGHPGKKALESMVKRAIGDEIEALITLQYSNCTQAKATRVVSRRPFKDFNDVFRQRLFFDLFILSYSYNGFRYVLLIKDEHTGYIWIYLLVDRI